MNRTTQKLKKLIPKAKYLPHDHPIYSEPFTIIFGRFRKQTNIKKENG